MDPSSLAQSSPANASAASWFAPRASWPCAVAGKAAELRALDHANDTAAAASEAVLVELSRALVAAVLAGSSQLFSSLDASGQMSFSPSRFAAAAPPTPRVALVREVAELRALLDRANDMAAAVSEAAVVQMSEERHVYFSYAMLMLFFGLAFGVIGCLEFQEMVMRRSRATTTAPAPATATATSAMPRKRAHADLAPFALPLATPSEYLPLPLVHNVVSRLPADALLRLAEVSRAMRAVVTDPLIWVDVDLSTSSGCGAVSEALVDAVFATSTQLRSLDVCGQMSFSPSRFMVATVVAASP